MCRHRRPGAGPGRRSKSDARTAYKSPGRGAYGLKDNICTRGMRTTCASKIWGTSPPIDATAVERLTAAGAVVHGKLNLDEFAMGSTCETSCYGPAKNPWDLTRSPAAPPAGRPPR